MPESCSTCKAEWEGAFQKKAHIIGADPADLTAAGEFITRDEQHYEGAPVTAIAPEKLLKE